MHGHENLHLPELKRFFSQVNARENGHTFIDSLRPFLTADIIAKKGDNLCDAIYDLRTNQRFMAALLTNWQLSEAFLEAVIANASPEKRQAIKGSRFSSIYRLNTLRRALLPEQMRRTLPIAQQQYLILSALTANRGARAANPVVMPTLAPAGERTQLIERLEEKGDIEIPKELICPLSHQMFVDPVKVIQNNHTDYFEREYLVQALKQKAENPLNRLPLTEQDLMEAPEKKAEVEAYKNDLLKRINHSTNPIEEQKKEPAPTLIHQSPPMPRPVVADDQNNLAINEEKNVFNKYNADQLAADALLERLRMAMKRHQKTSPMYQAAERVRQAAENLSHVMLFRCLFKGDLNKWKMSVVLAINLLDTPRDDNAEYSDAVHLLQANANRCATGKANGWGQFKVALTMLAGAALVTLGLAGTFFTAGLSGGLVIAGSLMLAGGGFFGCYNRHYYNKQKSLVQESNALAENAYWRPPV